MSNNQGSPFTPRTPEWLRAEYLRRAKVVDEASKRSMEMERDFLEKKVLNAQANEALEDFGRKRAQFGEWLLQVSDELFALSHASESAPTFTRVEIMGHPDQPVSARCILSGCRDLSHASAKR
jgi:hypothetical protein